MPKPLPQPDGFWPTTPEQAGAWTLSLCIFYLLIAFFFAAKRGVLDREFVSKVTYDSVTFGLASMLLVGVWHPAIFVLIGGITTPAIIAGISGVLYSFRSLFLVAEAVSSPKSPTAKTTAAQQG